MEGSRTYLLEFSLKTNLGDGVNATQLAGDEIKKLGFKPIYEQDFENNVKHTHFVHSNGNYASLTFYYQECLQLDINFLPQDKEKHALDKVVENLEQNILEKISPKKYKSLPGIVRGGSFTPYFPTTDNKLIEYDFDSCVFEEDSEFQNIKIMHSSQFGNMLLLDNDPNLAESDIAYTHAITGYPDEDYKDKTVLILGGGDGGILHELRKQKPHFITMVDIDGVVVEAARKHLRGICYDSLDSLKGDNYEVLVEDCIPVLKSYKDKGVQFDYVINDLTAIPCTTSPIGDQWDFLRLILDLSLNVLKPTGVYYTQGNGHNMKNALKMYEQQLEKLSSPVKFEKQPVCVPSYHELWMFYKIWKTQ